ncbi:MAG: DUF4339 domain-containing protein [Pelagibaca sp.]
MFRIFAILILISSPAFAQEGQRSVDRDTRATALVPPPVQIYITQDGQQIGPLDAAGFQAHLGSVQAATSTLVWMPGMSNWELASTVPQLQGIIAAIGQADVPPDQFTVTDIQSYMLGVWISEEFKWTQNDVPFDAIIQMKVLPNGRFEGATILWVKDEPQRPMRVDHEKGTWAITQSSEGDFNFERNITYSTVIGTEIVFAGQDTDTLTFKPAGPNTFKTVENIDIIRVPEAN